MLAEATSENCAPDRDVRGARSFYAFHDRSYNSSALPFMMLASRNELIRKSKSIRTDSWAASPRHAGQAYADPE